MVVSVPSLAERVDDIPILARHFARQSAGRTTPKCIDDDAIHLLMDVPWSGNIRELKQAVETALVFARGSVDAAAIRGALAHRSRDGAPVAAPGAATRRGDLVATLRDAAWDVDQAAARLGMHRATLYRRMKRLGIDAPRFHDTAGRHSLSGGVHVREFESRETSARP